MVLRRYQGTVLDTLPEAYICVSSPLKVKIDVRYKITIWCIASLDFHSTSSNLEKERKILQFTFMILLLSDYTPKHFDFMS